MARALSKSLIVQRPSPPSWVSPRASAPQLPNQSVQAAGMRDRLPSGSTASNNGTPRRFRPLMMARRHPSKGCRLRMMTTEVGRSWEWVVCGVFVRGYSSCRAFEVGITPDRRSARAASDQDVAGLPRRRNRRSRTEDTHDRGARQAARHPAGLTPYALNAKDNFRTGLGLTPVKPPSERGLRRGWSEVESSVGSRFCRLRRRFL